MREELLVMATEDKLFDFTKGIPAICPDLTPISISASSIRERLLTTPINSYSIVPQCFH